MKPLRSLLASVPFLLAAGAIPCAQAADTVFYGPVGEWRNENVGIDSEITEVNAQDATNIAGDPVDYVPELSYTLGAHFSFEMGSLPGYARDFDCRSWPELLLKFVLSHDAVTCPIPATSNPEHLEANVRAGFGRLPDAATREKMARVLA